jgi:hypothetical protein
LLFSLWFKKELIIFKVKSVRNCDLRIKPSIIL